MAIRTQIRLGQLSGSISDGGAPITEIGGDSLQAPLDAMGSAIRRIVGTTDFFRQKEGVFTHSLTQFTGSVSSNGSLTVGGNQILGGNAAAPTLAITLAGADVTIAGDVQVSGNDIKDAGGSAALTFNGSSTLATFPGDLKISGNDIQGSANNSAIVLGGDGTDNTVTLGLGAGLVDTVAKLKVGGNAVQNSAGVDSVVVGNGGTNVTVNLGAGTGLVTTAADLKVTGNTIQGSAANAAIELGGNGTNNTVTLGLGTGLVDTVAKLKVGGNAIQNSGGIDTIELQPQGVRIPGNLVVDGTTTSLDTINLDVEDRLIGLGFQSGSKGTAAADAGIIFANGGGDNIIHNALYYKNAQSTFQFIAGNLSPSGSAISGNPTAFRDVALRQLVLSGAGGGDGGQIYSLKGATPQVALQLSDDPAAAAPNVEISNHLVLKDDKQLRLGNAVGGDAQILHDAGTSQLEIRVANGQKLTFAEGANIVFSAFENTAGEEVFSIGQAAKGIVSGSAGRDLGVRGGNHLFFNDKYSEASSWADKLDGIQLAKTTAEWEAYATRFSTSESILGALVSAANSAGDALGGKKVFEIPVGGVSAGGNVNINIDLDDSGAKMSAADVEKRLDLFVNGQLLSSKSVVTGDGDYSVVGPPSNTTDITIEFALIEGDVVTAVVR